MKNMLLVFGPTLKELLYHSSYPSMVDFIPCICLESLAFSYFSSSSLDTYSEPPTHLNADNFLPMLKKFKSSCCLGSSWSRLFEEKTSLVSLNLNCCHVGIDDVGESQASLHQQPNKRLKLNVSYLYVSSTA